MKKQTKHIVTALTCAAGLSMVLGGSFKLLPAYASTDVTIYNNPNTVSIQTNGRIFENVANIGNIAPGDTEQGSMIVKNTGSQTTWVQLKHFLDGQIFQNNGVTKDTYSPGVTDSTKWESVDYKSTGNKEEFHYDNNPLQISATIQISGVNAPTNPIVIPAFSQNTISPPFQLGPGQTATVSYSYAMPLAAHNDYQNASGQMYVAIDASVDTDSYVPPHDPHDPTPPTNPTPPPTNPTPPPTNPTPPPTPPTVHPKPPVPVTTPPVVIGGTTPVTGLPFETIAFEGLALLVVGGGLLLLAKKYKS